MVQKFCLREFERKEILTLAASAEKYSTHPIARSIARACEAEFGATTHEITDMLEKSAYEKMDSEILKAKAY